MSQETGMCPILSFTSYDDPGSPRPGLDSVRVD